jgi:hypothetical protein
MHSVPLQVATDRGVSWNLTWALPNWPNRHYHVDKTILQDCGQDARKALQEVVDDAQAKKPLGPSLKKLAIAGASLREAIFLASGKEAVDAEFVINQLPATAKVWQLLITLDERVYVPWGLAYDGDPTLLPENPPKITPDLYGDFWCLKYNVCTLHSVLDPTGLLKPRSNNEVQMLRIINKPCWDAAEKALPPAEKTFFDAVWTRSRLPINTSEEFFKTWRQSRKDVDLLYLYCHANGTKLALSGTDEISTTKFRMNVRHDAQHTHPVCLVFLNGCQTAIGAEKGGFMEATGDTGFCGFIGTEAKIPDLFALRFATDFFWHLLYDEMTVGEIMEKLKGNHCPLSLVYSTCCHPLFKIKRIAPPPNPLPKSRNLSDEPLQASRLL